MNKTSNYANFAVNFVSFDFRLAALFFVQASLLSLTNSLDCIFVICHISYSFLLLFFLFWAAKLQLFCEMPTNYLKFFL